MESVGEASFGVVTAPCGSSVERGDVGEDRGGTCLSEDDGRWISDAGGGGGS